MTREEFIKRMDKVFNKIDRGRYSCNSIGINISMYANDFYNNEFRLTYGACWVHKYLRSLDSCRNNLRENKIMLRQFLVSWFKEWSLDNKYYLEY